MAIDFITTMIKPPVLLGQQGSRKYHPTKIHHLAIGADWTIGITLLIVGILSLMGVISLSLVASGLLIGIGATYTAFMILREISNQRAKCLRKKMTARAQQ